MSGSLPSLEQDSTNFVGVSTNFVGVSTKFVGVSTRFYIWAAIKTPQTSHQNTPKPHIHTHHQRQKPRCRPSVTKPMSGSLPSLEQDSTNFVGVSTNFVGVSTKFVGVSTRFYIWAAIKTPQTSHQNTPKPHQKKSKTKSKTKDKNLKPKKEIKNQKLKNKTNNQTHKGGETPVSPPSPACCPTRPKVEVGEAVGFRKY